MHDERQLFYSSAFFFKITNTN